MYAREIDSAKQFETIDTRLSKETIKSAKALVYRVYHRNKLQILIALKERVQFTSPSLNVLEH